MARQGTYNTVDNPYSKLHGLQPLRAPLALDALGPGGLHGLHRHGDDLVGVSPDGAALVPRAQEDVLDLLHGVPLRLRHPDEHEDEAHQDDAGEDKEQPGVADALGDVGAGGVQGEGGEALDGGHEAGEGGAGAGGEQDAEEQVGDADVAAAGGELGSNSIDTFVGPESVRPRTWPKSRLEFLYMFKLVVP